ncbi:MAG: glycosyltransferase [Cryomorphaceae bacterium]|nr:glycosyltransferase [Cryomorphaceae bacterium]
MDVIFAAYNEEKVLEEKLRSVLASDYPNDKLRIIVGSDASEDNTDTILEKFKAEDVRLDWKRFGGRSGKSHIINQLASESQADILIPTDANIIFSKDSVKNLVRWFQDDSVSIVGASINYQSPDNKGIAPQEDYYLKRENKIKELETACFGTAMGIEGGCYAIRKTAFKPIPKNYFMEDFYQSMQVLSRGEKVLVDGKALVYEDVSTEIGEEYKRKVRISIGNFQNLKHFGAVVFKKPYPLGWVFFSHKILRWLTPFFLLAMFVSAMLLAFRGFQFYQIMMALAVLWVAITVGHVKKIFKAGGILAFAAHFLYMNLALFHGCIQFIKGVKSNVWQPTKRKQV